MGPKREVENSRRGRKGFGHALKGEENRNNVAAVEEKGKG